MIIHDFSNKQSLLNQYIYELRTVAIQKDRMRFRKNIERVGEILGYEMSKMLAYHDMQTSTPLGSKSMVLPQQDLVLCSVLRAGLPLHQGLLNRFDTADNAFISAYRTHPEQGNDFEVVVRYFAAPDLSHKTLVLTDPMLATGKTLENVYQALSDHGTPTQIHIIAVIGSRQGVDYINRIFPEDTHLWIAAVDEELNNKGYIVPGLGDAGDLCYGLKL
ncbi:MAG: uracil phosphoribosyltransferase [Dokdonia sp.]|jgi:uracil phosphoribosyltransferase